MAPPPPQLKLDIFGIMDEKDEEANKLDPLQEPPAKPLTRTEKKERQKFVDEIGYFISTPIIVPRGYEDAGREIMGRYKMIRMADILKEQKQIFEKEVCCEFDAMVYISLCTLYAMPSHEVGRIYENLFAKFFDYPKLVSDYPAPTLEYSEHHLLMQLRSWIFKKQMEIIRKKS